MPTIKEYQAMLNIPERERDIVYCFNPKQTARRTLLKFLENVHATDIQKHMKIKGGKRKMCHCWFCNRCGSNSLWEFDFWYDVEDCQGKKCGAVYAWKSVRKIKDKGHYEGVTSKYEAWHANRRKTMVSFSLRMIWIGF